MKNLYESLGGEAAVDAAVDIFYRRILADDSISHFFGGVNMDAQAAKQKSFLTLVFGGPINYSGLDMRKAHAPLLKKGLNEGHFNSVAGHLQGTLEELGVSKELIDRVMVVAGSTHDDVLGL